MTLARSAALPLARRALVAWFVLLTAVVAVHPLVLDDELSDLLFFFAAGGSVCAALLSKLSGRLKHGTWRGHWLMILFLLLQGAGGFIQAWADSHGSDLRMLSWQDLFYTAAYGFALIYMVSTALPLRADGRMAVVVDGALLLLGMVLVGYQFLLVPSIEALAAASPQGETEIIRLWYPCCADLTVAVLLAAGPATRMSRLSYLLMLVGWVAWAAAESTFHLSSLILPEPPWYVKVCLMTGYVLISASICTDPRAQGSTDPGARIMRLGASMLFAVFAWIAAAATLTSLHVSGRKLDLVVLAALGLILALIASRLVWAIQRVVLLREQVSRLKHPNAETVAAGGQGCLGGAGRSEALPVHASGSEA